MRSKDSCSLLLLAALALPLLNCGSSPHGADEKYWLVATNVKLPYWQNASNGLIRAARELEVKAEVAGPDTFDPKAEVDEFRRVLSRNPTGILIQVSDPKLLTPEINAAIAKGIPVIAMDSDAPDSKRLLFIGTNNYQAGLMGGRLAAKHLGGKGTVAIYTISEQVNLNERLHGYQDVFSQQPGIKITQTIDMRGVASIAFDRTMEMIEKGKAVPDAFICLEAVGCAEVADVLDRKHVEGKLIVAMDTHDNTLEWIQKGKIAATIAQKPYTMAFYGLKMLDDLHHHKLPSLDASFSENPFSPVPMMVDTGATLIDKSNVQHFLQQQQGARPGS